MSAKKELKATITINKLLLQPLEVIRGDVAR
jgi:hypothetical protein